MPITNIPRHLPDFRVIVEDLGATPQDVAQTLKVGNSTAYRWLQTNNAPRSATLALFWVSRWGMSALDAEMHNRAAVFQGLAQAMERELWQQRQDFAKLANIGHYGSANDPLPHVAPVFGLDYAKPARAARTDQPRNLSQDTPPPLVLLG